MRDFRLTLWLWLALCAGCAGHRVPHIAPDESQPHVSWEIRTGGDLGNDRLVCGSSQSPICGLEASTERSPTRITVHLSLHAAARQTDYLGFMRLPFVQGAAQAKSGEINATVRPGSASVGSTVSGIVTREPGTYTFAIAVDAMQEGWSAPQRTAHDVDVRVR